MQNVLNYLRSAGLPKLVEKTTLELEGQPALREIVKTGGYATDDGPVSFFLRGHDAPQVVRVSAVFCKELILSKVKALYVSAAYLHSICQYHETHGESESLLGLDGKYLVVPDLFESHWYVNEAGRGLVYSYLRSRYYRGNGLAICGVVGGYFGDEVFDQLVFSLPTVDLE
jgi:hypothetical protein